MPGHHALAARNAAQEADDFHEKVISLQFSVDAFPRRSVGTRISYRFTVFSIFRIFYCGAKPQAVLFILHPSSFILYFLGVGPIGTGLEIDFQRDF